MLPTDPGDTEWKDEGTRKVTPWKYLGLRDVGGEQVRFRARLCRYDTANGYSLEPEVQYRWGEHWSNGFNVTSMKRAQALAASAIHAAKKAVA